MAKKAKIFSNQEGYDYYSILVEDRSVLIRCDLSMNGALATTLNSEDGRNPAGLLLRVGETRPARCFHCGESSSDFTLTHDSKTFCCRGCLIVHDLLAEAGLEHFYKLSPHPGSRMRGIPGMERWTFLDDPAVRQRLLDFNHGALSRITFPLPAIHCISCVWLLENLFRLHPGVGRSTVRFARREATIDFDADKIRLSELASLLASIGYEPALTLERLDDSRPRPAGSRQWIQLGIAGFAFANIMLLTLPKYFGLDQFNGPGFKALFGWISMVLALPVLLYSASDYWKSALLSIRRRALALDVPIALGLAALYAQSAWEILSGHGSGYLDSLVGLVFFLLCGRAFQHKTYERLSFERDFKSFFPLSVLRRTAAGEESVALSRLQVGDRIAVRNGELIPADAVLESGRALIDYSFVSGESEPVPKMEGDYLYAGGKQVGGRIELAIVKPVSQSYLASLWNHDAFRKAPDENLNSLTNRYSRWFTLVVIAIALGAAVFWIAAGDSARALKAFASVLIVACPCALALAAPFAFGTAQRFLARIGVFTRNTFVFETLARVDSIVFDKTGTLTSPDATDVRFESRSQPNGAMAAGSLTPAEAGLVYSVARHSTHPHSVRLAGWLFHEREPREIAVESFREVPGRGLEARADGRELLLGSSAWLESRGIDLAGSNGSCTESPGSAVHVAIDGRYRGAFILAVELRPEAGRLVRELGESYRLALLSGDNDKQRRRFSRLLGADSPLWFGQKPLDKLGFIRALQESGKTVMMVGDGLNDAGALRQSDVGVAVVEKIGAFSPASDVILDAARLGDLPRVLALGRASVNIVRFGCGLSAAYNLVGVSIAAAGFLSPLLCAVLMPLSSVSVVVFAWGATRLAARRMGLGQAIPPRFETALSPVQPAFQT